MIKSFDDLNQKIEVCSKALENKFAGEDGKRAIVLCGGTGCLSSNSAEIQAKFERLVKENDMEDIVSVNKVGCFGFCSQGPFVKIYPEDTLYRLVTIDDVDEIFEQDIKNHEVVERLLFVDPATHEKVTAQDDINFYKKQVRVALHGCGQINPEKIDEALGFGAFRGLERALKMDRADVVKEVLDSGLRSRTVKSTLYVTATRATRARSWTGLSSKETRSRLSRAWRLQATPSAHRTATSM